MPSTEPPRASEAARASRALGAMFFAVFGSAWLVLGAVRALDHPAWAIAAVVVIGVAAFAAALRRYLQLRPALAAEADSPARQKTSRRFNLINAAQWMVILVGGNVLANIGLAAWVIPAAIFVVGLHFIPLARLFNNRAHYVTGIALMLIAVGYPLLAPGGPASAAGCLGAGVVLWASSLWAVRPN